MKVKLLSKLNTSDGFIKGVVDLPQDVAEDYIRRGIAVKEVKEAPENKEDKDVKSRKTK